MNIISTLTGVFCDHYFIGNWLLTTLEGKYDDSLIIIRIIIEQAYMAMIKQQVNMAMHAYDMM